MVRVTPEWFGVLRVSLRRGRAFGTADRAGAPSVVIVSETAARRLWPDESPLGRRLAVSQRGFEEASGGAEVVGVARDVYTHPDSAPGPTIYLPYAQAPVPGLTIAVRSAADPRALAPDLRRAVAALDPLLPLSNLKPLADLVDASIAARRFAMLLAELFAGVSLLLSAVGLYGVLAHLVAARASEVGVRLALGATSANVMWLFLREGLWLTLAGLTAGLAAARATAGVLASSLVGVTASDPATLASVAVTLAAVALLAIALPVRRATRIDPASLVRDV
jgi:hypothetical protein